MLSQFFIRRPIFAAVLSLLFLISGAIAVWQLPITEYPEVVPPTVVVMEEMPIYQPTSTAVEVEVEVPMEMQI